jgi:GT2 family glycosyltransferase
VPHPGGQREIESCLVTPQMKKPIRLVCATRQHPDKFMDETALGRSLKNFSPQPEPQLQLFGSNTLGLSTVYNIAIKHAEQDPAILVFLHDDVYLTDHFWMERIYEGLEQFDVIGLAGNTRRVPKQPAWAFTTAVPNLTWDERRFLSGTVGHGQGFPCKNISIFGPSRQECKLLDGLFLAADSDVLNKHGVGFDEQFAFHFYDMDFCRQAEQKGLRMGTWPIAVVHESGGAFGSQGWKDGYAKYLRKYAEGEGGAAKVEGQGRVGSAPHVSGGE